MARHPYYYMLAVAFKHADPVCLLYSVLIAQSVKMVLTFHIWVSLLPAACSPAAAPRLRLTP